MDERRAWERKLGDAGWNCVGWPQEYGGRGLSLMQQVIFFEEYARADAPGRLGHIGEGLLGPTIIAFGIIAHTPQAAAATMCDVNGDGVIDQDDIHLIEAARGTTESRRR